MGKDYNCIEGARNCKVGDTSRASTDSKWQENHGGSYTRGDLECKGSMWQKIFTESIEEDKGFMRVKFNLAMFFQR